VKQIQVFLSITLIIILGHAEVCQLEYDKNIISFEKILEYFFKFHDPTQLNVNINFYLKKYRDKDMILVHNIDQ
jgi:peptide-methionine (S)-S-oxide reductase